MCNIFLKLISILEYEWYFHLIFSVYKSSVRKKIMKVFLSPHELGHEILQVTTNYLRGHLLLTNTIEMYYTLYNLLEK